MGPQSLTEILTNNQYPGRGILLGRSADGENGVIAYFIMGRSPNSRNRIFEETRDGIRTKAYDEEKLTDPSLIIYHPVRAMEYGTIVTNGDQTDTVLDHLRNGLSFEDALRTRCFEPDPPICTPRISGFMAPDGSFKLSILKSAEGNQDCNLRFFYEYDKPVAGEGRLIHTYQQNGDTPPSFEGEPRRVSLTAANADTLADEIWQSLNEDNKVSLFVRYIHLESGAVNSVIRNKYI